MFTLNEFKERKNQHMTHLEDLVLLGSEGIEELNDKIDKYIYSVESTDGLPDGITATTKIDGAPAVVCFSKFEGYPDNSICLKSFLTSNKNCLSSVEDIDDRYGDRPEMAEKLKYALSLSNYIPAGEAWQGDCLFTANTLKEVTIEGKDYLTFQPNKIIYAFTEDNPDFEEIAEADFGICFHTIYRGDLINKSQSFKIDLGRLGSYPNNIYIMSHELIRDNSEGIPDLTKFKAKYNELKKAESRLLSNPAYEELINNSTFMNYWNTFENKSLADMKSTNINSDTLYNDLTNYINSKLETEYNKKLPTLKTDKGRETAKTTYDNKVARLSELIDTNKYLLIDLVNCLNLAADIKMMMWEDYKKSKFNYNTFYNSRSQGYIPADMEGVALSSGPDIVKIVDRSVFSNVNRSDDFISGFEHN